MKGRNRHGVGIGTRSRSHVARSALYWLEGQLSGRIRSRIRHWYVKFTNLVTVCLGKQETISHLALTSLVVMRIMGSNAIDNNEGL